MPRWDKLAKQALNASASQAIDRLNPDLVKIEPIQMYYRRLYLTIIPPFADSAYNKFKKADIGIPLQPDETNPVWDEIILRFLSGREMASRITGISENTKELFRRILQQAQADGLSNQQTAKLLKDSYAMSRKRALVISRTELGTAEMTGEYVGMQRLGLEGYPVKKTWNARLDQNTRDAHVALHGVTIPLNEDFDVFGARMSRPLDPKGPAEQVINCRCALTYSL